MQDALRIWQDACAISSSCVSIKNIDPNANHIGNAIGTAKCDSYIADIEAAGSKMDKNDLGGTLSR